eukprot:g5147.t1
MQHEILLALVGHPGEVIIDLGDKGFKVAPDLNFLSEADRELINRIIKCGWYFRELTRFVARQRRYERGIPISGLYMRAVCSGVEEVLDEYRWLVVASEESFLENSELPMVKLAQIFSEYDVLLPILWRLIELIEEKKMKGLQLVDILHLKSMSGSVVIESCILGLLNRCLGVLFNQILAWTVHGILVDHYDEFFIMKRHGPPSGPSTPATVIAEHEWNVSFKIRFEMLPRNLLPLATAEKILFCGKAVRVLKRSSPGNRSQSDQYGNDVNFEDISRSQGAVSLSESGLSARDETIFTKALLRLRATTTQPKGEDYKIQRLNVLQLESTIESLRTTVAKLLFQLVVRDGRLFRILCYMRNFFLLGDGHFFQDFVVRSRALMQLPPNVHAERDINAGPWQTAAQTVRLTNNGEDFFRRGQVAILDDALGFGTGIFPSNLFTNDNVPSSSHSFVKRKSSKQNFWNIDSNNENDKENYREDEKNLAGKPIALFPSQSELHDIELERFFFSALKLRLDTSEFTFSNFGNVDGLLLIGSAHHHIAREKENDVTSGSSSWNDFSTNEKRPKISASSNTSSISDSLESSLAQSPPALILAMPPNTLNGSWCAGAVWTAQKKRVGNGFTTTFNFSSGEGTDSLAFVIQNHRATALGTYGENIRNGTGEGLKESQSTGSSHRTSYFGDSIARSVSVRIQLRPNGDAHVSVRLGEKIVKSESVSAQNIWHEGENGDENASSSLQRETSSPLILSARIVYSYELFAKIGRHWALSVFLENGSSRGSSTSGKGTLALRAPIDLGRSVTDATNGRAWIGFTSCARRGAGGDPEDLLRIFSWRFRAAPLGGSKALPGDVWQELSLSYEVQWPLQLVITQESLEQYNSIFQFLLTTKRVSAELQLAWVNLNATRYRLSSGKSRQMLMRLWLLRSQMAFLVENLQFYLQEDVIDVQFSEMQKSIKEAIDFDTVVRAHQCFLENVISQSFLSVKIIRVGLHDVLRTCLAFGDLITRFTGRKDVSLTDISKEDVDKIEKAFQSTSAFLVTMLTRSRVHAALVLRLDFNNFFSKT